MKADRRKRKRSSSFWRWRRALPRRPTMSSSGNLAASSRRVASMTCNPLDGRWRPAWGPKLPSQPGALLPADLGLSAEARPEFAGPPVAAPEGHTVAEPALARVQASGPGGPAGESGESEQVFRGDPEGLAGRSVCGSRAMVLLRAFCFTPQAEWRRGPSGWTSHCNPKPLELAGRFPVRGSGKVAPANQLGEIFGHCSQARMGPPRPKARNLGEEGR